MGRIVVWAAWLLVAALVGTPANAADKVQRERVSFSAGATGASVSGRLAGYDSVEYLVGARAGQHMSIGLQADNGMAYFNVFAPGDKPGASEAIFAGPVEGDTFNGALAESGDYLIQVFLMRAGARRHETATYTLRIDITGPAAATAGPQPDFADGLAGGPDLWQVSGLAPGDTLNLRAQPSPDAEVLGQFRPDTVLRNRGCRMEGGQRWCSVETTTAGLRGWVAGRYLREAGADAYSAVSEGGDALVAGTDFNAAGTVPCAAASGQPTAPCPFGVTRQGAGNATVVVTLPDGRERAIVFQGGEANAADLGDALTATRQDDLSLIRIGAERYEIPDVVVWGD